jgi:predicted DCC family thiol-disulfide oxidoreductase YuxK
VLYDATCPFCLDLMVRVQGTLQAGGFRLEPLQSPWVRERLKLPEDQLLAEMRVLTRRGQVLGGADALVHLAKELDRRKRPWWAWLLVGAGKIPFGMRALRYGYRWIAARRYCRQGVCAVENSQIAKKEGMQ